VKQDHLHFSGEAEEIFGKATSHDPYIRDYLRSIVRYRSARFTREIAL
jgi:hypothetical protein